MSVNLVFQEVERLHERVNGVLFIFFSLINGGEEAYATVRWRGGKTGRPWWLQDRITSTTRAANVGLRFTTLKA